MSEQNICENHTPRKPKYRLFKVSSNCIKVIVQLGVKKTRTHQPARRKDLSI